MGKLNELIEWDYLGSRYSLYIKHFLDDHGNQGMTMIYEDVTHEKVTEMVIPPRQYASFLRAVTGADPRYRMKL